MSRLNFKALACSKGLFIVMWLYFLFTIAYAMFTGPVRTEKKSYLLLQKLVNNASIVSIV